MIFIAAAALSQSLSFVPWPDVSECSDQQMEGTLFVSHLLESSEVAPAMTSYRWVPNQTGLERYRGEVERVRQAAIAASSTELRPQAEQAGEWSRFCSPAETVEQRNQCQVYSVFSVLLADMEISSNREFSIVDRRGFPLGAAGSNQIEVIRRSNAVADLLVNAENFVLRCPAPEGEAQDPSQTDDETTQTTENTSQKTPMFERSGSRLLLTGAVSDFDEADLEDRSFATYTFTDEVRADSETWDINVALGYNWTFLPTSRAPTRINQIDLTPFVSVRRKGGDLDDPEDELNEFSAGVAWAMRHIRDVNGPTRFTLLSGDFRWITDDSADARAVAATLRYPLPFWSALGYRQWSDLGTSDWELNWSTEPVFEGVWIDNPGDTFPTGLNEYRRVGADTRFALRYNREGMPFVPSVNLSYAVRDDLDPSGAADAAIFKGSVALAPNDESNYQISLQYRTGQDLTKLTEQQQWQIVFGVRY